MRVTRLSALFLALCVSPAFASWTVTASEGYACNSPTALKQLQMMSALPSAFEIALLDKLSSGECKKLKQGEAVENLEDSNLPPLTVKIRRRNGDELFAPEHFIGQST